MPPSTRLTISSLAKLPAEKRHRILSALTESELDALLHNWRFVARPNQLEPDGDWWTIWLLRAGRGFGKTRTGAEWIRERVKNGYRWLGMIGSTSDDVRSVMVEGMSGLLSVCHPGDVDINGNEMGMPEYQPSRRRVVWPNIGAVCRTFSAEEPERLRGPNHDSIWADEIGAWARAQDTWDNAMFGLRIGHDPRIVATTTPRPTPLMLDLRKEEGKTLVMTDGSSFANRANLAPTFFDTIIRRYQGTRLYRQEVLGELLEDVPGALFERKWFDKAFVTKAEVPELVRVTVAVDPSGTKDDDPAMNEGHDPIGIVAAGLGIDGKGYILRDATMLEGPRTWARAAVGLYKTLQADRIVAEQNFGGGMVEAVIRAVDRAVPYVPVVASRGKTQRAEPVSALMQQGRIKFVISGEVKDNEMIGREYSNLIDELCNFTQHGYVGPESPNRGDAMIWAITDLMLSEGGYVLSDAALS